MARCPRLEVKDTGILAWAWYCGLTRKKLGDENHKDLVRSLCDCSGECRYEQCEVWRKHTRW